MIAQGIMAGGILSVGVKNNKLTFNIKRKKGKNGDMEYYAQEKKEKIKEKIPKKTAELVS